MNLGTKITIYKFTPQVFTLTPSLHDRVYFRLDDSLTGRDAIIASISRK